MPFALSFTQRRLVDRVDRFRPAVAGGLASAVTVLGLCSGAHAAGNEQMTDLGTVASFALPAVVAGLQVRRGDTEGLRQYALTWGSTVALTEVLKRTTGKERPDGTNELSFPSGHAARAFGAAAHLNRREGLGQAWPFYAGALFVGWTRVQADRHDWLDVAGALAVSEWMARTWTTPRHRGAQLSAGPVPGGWAVQLSMPL